MAVKKESFPLTAMTDLVQDYLNNDSKTSEFYRWHPADNWQDCIQLRADSFPFRTDLKEILEQQNKNWQNKPEALSNIKKVEHDNSVAVVTGQQAGLFGGPLYTAYKVLGAIQLSKRLEENYPGWNFIPVFWMEVGDNDFKEINRFHLINMQNELIRLGVSENPDDHRSIHHRRIPSDISLLFDQLEEHTVSSEFRDGILETLKNNYAVGKRFSDAFAEFFIERFGDLGLVIFDPTQKECATLAVPLFERALVDAEKIQGIFQETSRELQNKNYLRQISLDTSQTMVFTENENKDRCRIDFDKQNFVIKGPSGLTTVSSENVIRALRENPENFSPNVVLRALMQDFLLPTVAYIAGPSELSYAAQFCNLYLYFDIVPPVFYPRPRMTLVENKIDKIADKFSLHYENIFKNQNGLEKQYLEDHKEEEMSQEWLNAIEQIEEAFTQIENSLQKIDSTLKGSVTKTRKNVENLLKKLNSKADQALKRKMEIELNQLNKLLIHLFPENQFQERVLGLINYEIKYGPDVTKVLLNNMDVTDWEHQIIFLE